MRLFAHLERRQIFVSFLLAGVLYFGICGTANSAPQLETGNPDDSETSRREVGASTDRTDNLLAEYYASKGLRPLQEVEIAGTVMHIYSTRAAETIIQNRNFEIPDSQFDLMQFTGALTGVFSDGVQYFKSVVPGISVPDFHVIIDDLGEARQTTSAVTFRNSRVMRLDVRRWHKMYRDQRSDFAYTSSIHEFTHIVNYTLDPAENQYHRELTAVFFEAMNYIRRNGIQEFKTRYLRGQPLKSPSDVISPAFVNNTPLRYIIHSMLIKLLDGTYKAGDAATTLAARGKACEEFATLYLSNVKTGENGFNDPLVQLEFRDASNAPLTLKNIQADLYSELTR